MTNQNLTANTPKGRRLARLAPLAAAVAMFGAACGSTTTASTPADSLPTSPPETVSETTPPVTEAPPVAEAPPITEAPPVTEAPPSTDAPPATDAPPTTEADLATPPPPPPPAPCGEFGDFPPRPDSMPTKNFDTNGDGTADAVTAYAGGGEGWKLRVVENGITSEALIPAADGFAALDGSVVVHGREHVLVRDFETNDVHTFATNRAGCVEFLSTTPGSVPDPSDGPVLVAPTPPPGPCGEFGPIPADSMITSDLTVDLVGDGVADDRVITYLDGEYTLRSIRNGVVSEIVVPDVGVSSIRALGVGNLGEISAGNEIVARTGGGASAAEIDFFGHDADGCVFEFTLNGGDLDMYVGATIGTQSGMFCDVGVIGGWYYELDDDGTYFGSGAAYFESSPGDFTYLPASDDFSEGLTVDELSPATLDCFGFGL